MGPVRADSPVEKGRDDSGRTTAVQFDRSAGLA